MNGEIKTPKITVIMPFYNCEKYLDDSIQSILNQTFGDFEFIIINDASTDASDRVITKYLNDKRIIYIKNDTNLGIVQNLNKGIEIAKGEYIARMDGDDISVVDRFEKQILFLEENKDIDIVGGYLKVIDENNNEIGEIKKPISEEDVRKNLFIFLTIVHGSAIIRKHVYFKVGLYRDKYIYTEDTDWTYRCIYSGFKGANIPYFLYKYRKHSNSSSKNSKIIAKRNFELRKEMIHKFNLKLSFKEYVGMYVHYFVGMLLTPKQKEKLEYFIKKIIIR